MTMNVEPDDPIFTEIVPGKPGYFYTREYGQDKIREVHRDGSGRLWLSMDGCGVRLEDADIYILGAVPPVDSLEESASVTRAALRETKRRRMAALMARGHLEQIDWAKIPTDHEIEEHVRDALYALSDD